MEPFEHRIINGLLKGGIETPEEAVRLLTRDVEVYVDASRARELQPVAWGLVSVLRRQFFGAVTIHGVDSCADVPIGLNRLVSTQRSGAPTITIGLGTAPPQSAGATLWGDVKGSTIAFGAMVPDDVAAHPIAAFALAGYLGFAALAVAIGLDPFRASLANNNLQLDLPERTGRMPNRIALLGLGQLGQAYLALLHFLYIDGDRRPELVLLDYQRFGSENFATQILLDPDETRWVGVKKVDYLASILDRAGWTVEALNLELGWSTPQLTEHPPIALVGFDNLEARRMAASWGFQWIIESGVGASLSQPRVTWSSIPPDASLAQSLFQEAPPGLSSETESAFVQELRKTPGQCGWLTFQGIAASAPSLGLVAAAYALAELLRWSAGERIPVRGIAHLWSPILPYLREALG